MTQRFSDNIPFSGSQLFNNVTNFIETMSTGNSDSSVNKKQLTTAETVFLIIFSILMLFLMGFAVQYLWNGTFVKIVPGVKSVNYQDALSLLVLFRILM